MKIKNEQGIEELALTHISQFEADDYENVTQYAFHTIGEKDGFIRGYSQAQQDLLSQTSEGFEEWLTNYFSLEGSTDIEEDINMQSIEYDELKEAWQAAKLSQAKELEKLRGIVKNMKELPLTREIIRLQKENEELTRTVAKINEDFWFMINLIERYSTDKDETLKDVLERMKFRKPVLEKWLKGEAK